MCKGHGCECGIYALLIGINKRIGMKYCCGKMGDASVYERR